MRRPGYPLLILLALAALLVLVRAALPGIVKDQVNSRLQGLEAYDGSIEDIDIALWRGAYRIEGLRIVKEEGERHRPFFSAQAVDFSIEWRSLLRGAVVAAGVFHAPNLNLIEDPDEERAQLGEEENWTDRLQELVPFRINTLEIRDGTVSFLAPGIQSEDALTAHRIHGAISNLTNVAATAEEAFAAFQLEGAVLGEAPLRLGGRVDPSASQPTFEVDLELEDVQLPQVNPWLRRFIKAEADSGDFQLYLELAAAEGRFEGYAKPLMQNVELGRTEEAESNPLRRLWEGVVEFAAELLENPDEDQIGARIPFSGSIQDPEAHLLATMASVLRNAFVSAFARSLEGSITLRDVKDDLADYGEPQSE